MSLCHMSREEAESVHNRNQMETVDCTLESLQKYATQHDLQKLPPARDIKWDKAKPAGVATLLKASVPQRIRIGWAHIVFGPASGQSRCALAYISSRTQHIGIDDVHFCLSDDTVIPRGTVSKVDLTFPFSTFKSLEIDNGKPCRRLQTLVLYYYLVKGYLQHVRLTKAHLVSFEMACSLVARTKKGRLYPYETFPALETVAVTAEKCQTDTESDGHKEEELQIETVGEQTSPEKKRKMNDGMSNDATAPLQHVDTTPFAEYQRLVQMIRKESDIEISSLKEDNCSLKKQLSLVHAREAETVKGHEDRYEALDNATKEEIKGLQAQIQELQAFKTSIQRVCGGVGGV
ncbi:hypothetical protein E8E13_008645 [Curvularia kusanoi]|uniref:Uncharacterized protein n=1 Tax=Curvularia kusanoi TaxID=90978 RepID=A0A9P4TGN2_CURKU|nr:hypothetical protein E8E13_008645 [Curvularia kusanoi]